MILMKVRDCEQANSVACRLFKFVYAGAYSCAASCCTAIVHKAEITRRGATEYRMIKQALTHTVKTTICPQVASDDIATK
jgi:hypothetical protein